MNENLFNVKIIGAMKEWVFFSEHSVQCLWPLKHP